MIRSFADKDTEKLWRRTRVKRFESVERIARRKLEMVNAAATLTDLTVPPGNRLEPLRGDRLGQHSIRINDQFRICFRWTEAGPEDVEICDYH
ncbi:type II toxin-antitoxin system RelE/ParE family toxin [Amycolatopsis alkalitolerans]|uniref:Plasmid maintenance system killer n=1 Tax=Amycolatopsis alkalitolerans TaxID=2547244 RepID=A0A5C4LY97_9PSEU|nr:type II toxin-antitoxin system RelE/ParE family toxin [Amycolatopsis alkalitolerans]TNC24113.1 plasmid maintenance system killer [Amycolatopsis alkalitolerans]